MKTSLRIVGTSLLVACCAFGMLALAREDRQTGKRMFECCTFPVTIENEVVIAQGVWYGGDCICPIANPDLNPNQCPLFCEFPF